MATVDLSYLTAPTLYSEKSAATGSASANSLLTLGGTPVPGVEPNSNVPSSVLGASGAVPSASSDLFGASNNALFLDALNGFTSSSSSAASAAPLSVHHLSPSADQQQHYPTHHIAASPLDSTVPTRIANLHITDPATHNHYGQQQQNQTAPSAFLGAFMADPANVATSGNTSLTAPLAAPDVSLFQQQQPTVEASAASISTPSTTPTTSATLHRPITHLRRGSLDSTLSVSTNPNASTSLHKSATVAAMALAMAAQNPLGLTNMSFFGSPFVGHAQGHQHQHQHQHSPQPEYGMLPAQHAHQQYADAATASAPASPRRHSAPTVVCSQMELDLANDLVSKVVAESKFNYQRRHSIANTEQEIEGHLRRYISDAAFGTIHENHNEEGACESVEGVKKEAGEEGETSPSPEANTSPIIPEGQVSTTNDATSMPVAATPATTSSSSSATPATTDRAYACSLCPASFRRVHDLKRHVRSIHTGIKPYICLNCHKRFSRLDALKRHMTRAGSPCCTVSLDAARMAAAHANMHDYQMGHPM